MVVAGLLTGIQNDAPVLEYEILATQSTGDYKVDGKYNSSQVCLKFVFTYYIVESPFLKKYTCTLLHST